MWIRIATAIALVAATAVHSRPAYAAACEATGELVLYTSQLEKDVKAFSNAFSQRCPTIELTWVRASTAGLLEMIDLELAEGEVNADVLLVSDVMHLMPLKLEERLEALPEIDIAEIEPIAVDPHRMYFGTRLATSVIVVGEDIEAPDGWRALEAFAGNSEMALPDPMRFIAAYNHMVTIVQNDELSWRHLEALQSGGARPEGGFGRSLAAVAAGGASVGITLDHLAVAAQSAGAPIQIVFPKEGAPALTDPVAVLRGTSHRAAAVEFVRFLLSETGQDHMRSHGFVPVRRDFETPDGFPRREDMSFMPLDPIEAVRRSTDIKERYIGIFSPGEPGG